MREEKPDWVAMFDADNYLYFHAEWFHGPARTALEDKFLREHFPMDQSHSVLDLACGHGRHSNRLARTVKRVVAWDTSSRFLEIARGDADAGGITNVEYHQRDIKTLDAEVEFERALLLNTVFGIFDDDESLDLLLRIHRALRPGGLLCFDVVNRDTILVDFQPESVLEKDGNFLIDRLAFEPKTGRMWNRRVYIRDGRETHAPFWLRLFNYTELSAILSRAGFTIREAFGSWNAELFAADSKKIVVIAQKH